VIAGRADVGVVFDLDGVLVLSEHLWEESWQEYARLYGYVWTIEDTRTCQGMSVTEWARYLAARSSGDPAEVAATVVALVAAAYRGGRVTLVKGAERLVADASARVPIGLASSAPREIIDTVMATMGLGRYFSATVSSAEVSHGKPSPDVYCEAIIRLGVDPAVSLAVEDSSSGVRAAAAAGLTVIAVADKRYPLSPAAIALATTIRAELNDVRGDIDRLLDERSVGGRSR
jgi:HAD superfamily hydrolase (TIGR01509 family)